MAGRVSKLSCCEKRTCDDSNTVIVVNNSITAVAYCNHYSCCFIIAVSLFFRAGCGKSTLVTALLKVMPYSAGQVLIGGKVIFSYSFFHELQNCFVYSEWLRSFRPVLRILVFPRFCCTICSKLRDDTASLIFTLYQFLSILFSPFFFLRLVNDCI